MALKLKQSVSLSGDSIVNDQTVASFSAQIPQDSGNTNVNISIINQQLYDANRKVVRDDQATFQDKVYDTEDSLMDKYEDGEYGV